MDQNKSLIHGKCCDLLAYCAYNNQELPSTALQALEDILKTGDAPICNTVISTLCRATLNGQVVSQSLVDLLEFDFTKHEANRINIVSFLYELVDADLVRKLSPTMYQGLSHIILDTNQDIETH